MSTDERSQKDAAKRPRHERGTWPRPNRTTSPPRAWTNKTMHHPATRIGEIRHGKS
jgi:hypothetical protein